MNEKSKTNNLVIKRENADYIEFLKGFDKSVKRAQQLLEELNKVKREEPKQEEKVWSADGIALEKPQNRFYTDEGKNLMEWGKFEPNAYRSFKTKERAELEREKRKVEYFMKKMACELNGTNEWRAKNYKIQRFNYFIYYCTREKIFIIDGYESCVLFNQSYFNTEKDAKDCLDKLIEKYGEERLKRIWGLK